MGSPLLRGDCGTGGLGLGDLGTEGGPAGRTVAVKANKLCYFFSVLRTIPAIPAIPAMRTNLIQESGVYKTSEGMEVLLLIYNSAYNNLLVTL